MSDTPLSEVEILQKPTAEVERAELITHLASDPYYQLIARRMGYELDTWKSDKKYRDLVENHDLLMSKYVETSRLLREVSGGYGWSKDCDVVYNGHCGCGGVHVPDGERKARSLLDETTRELQRVQQQIVELKKANPERAEYLSRIGDLEAQVARYRPFYDAYYK